MSILKPHTVTVITTDKCTAECRHCCMNSGPDREHRLSYEQIERALLGLFENYPMNVVVFAGGEPTLLGQDLLRAIRLVKDHGVVSRVVTNAYWAHSPEAASAKLRELRAAGLDELNISMDDYHEPYVAFERVRNAYRAALEIDFSAIAIANCYGPQSVLTPEFLEAEFGMKGAEMQRRFDVDGKSIKQERKQHEKMIVLSNGCVQRLGRGLDLVDDTECTDTSINMQKLGESIGGCPWAIRSMAVTPRAHLVSCCGFELHGNPILDYGSIDDHGVKALVDKADNDLITNMIAMIGPPKLKDLLQELCPDEVHFPRKTYRSYCETCQDLVGIEKNRKALEKYQGMFADFILAAREKARTKVAEQEAQGTRPVPLQFKIPGLRIMKTSDVDPETVPSAASPP